MNKLFSASLIALWVTLSYGTFNAAVQAQQSGIGGVWFTLTDNNPFDGIVYVEGHVWSYNGTEWVYGPPEDLSHFIEDDHHCPEHPVVPVDPTPPPAVPLPAAVWLFGSAILALITIARRNRLSKV
jgi:hypothetical protein